MHLLLQQKGTIAEEGEAIDLGQSPGRIAVLTAADTEIAVLAAAREGAQGRVIAVCQPHRYSRTVHLMDDFGRSFYQADSVYVLEIYAASERAIEGVSGQAIVERLRAYGHRSAEYAGTMDRAVEAVLAEAREGDLIITLGAATAYFRVALASGTTPVP